MQPSTERSWVAYPLDQHIAPEVLSKRARVVVLHKLQACVATAKGLRPDNQDRSLVARIHSKRDGRVLSLGIIADGMGGMDSGGAAATAATVAFLEYCYSNRTMPTRKLIEEGFKAANRQVYELLKEQGGTTLVVAMWSQGQLFFGHVGDSRAYGISSERELVRLTVDDTLADHYRPTDDPDAADDASDNTRLLQYVGMQKSPRVTIREAPAGLRAVILTTDGVHGTLDNASFSYISTNAKGLKEMADSLLDMTSLSGPPDNATIVSLAAWEDVEPVHEGLIEVITGNGSIALFENNPVPAPTQASHSLGIAPQLHKTDKPQDSLPLPISGWSRISGAPENREVEEFKATHTREHPHKHRSSSKQASKARTKNKAGVTKPKLLVTFENLPTPTQQFDSHSVKAPPEAASKDDRSNETLPVEKSRQAEQAPKEAT